MDSFNYKEYLAENRLGPYSKTSLKEDVFNPFEESAIDNLWKKVEADLFGITQNLHPVEEATRLAKDIANSLRIHMVDVQDFSGEEYDEEEYIRVFNHILRYFYSDMPRTRAEAVNVIAGNLKWESSNSSELGEILRQFAKEFNQN